MTTLVLALGALVVAASAAAPSSAPPASAPALEALRRAAGGVAGWAEQKDSYRPFTPRELYGIIDGGAVVYEQQGLVRGVAVSLGNGSRSLDLFVDEFDTAAHASGMVTIKEKASAAPQPLAAVAPRRAVYDEVLGGCAVYWATGRHYIEMIFTGYESTEAARRDAALFVDAMARASGG